MNMRVVNLPSMGTINILCLRFHFVPMAGLYCLIIYVEIGYRAHYSEKFVFYVIMNDIMT